MIKVNIVINHSIWKRQITNPQRYINRRLRAIYNTKKKGESIKDSPFNLSKKNYLEANRKLSHYSVNICSS